MPHTERKIIKLVTKHVKATLTRILQKQKTYTNRVYVALLVGIREGEGNKKSVQQSLTTSSQPKVCTSHIRYMMPLRTV